MRFCEGELVSFFICFVLLCFVSKWPTTEAGRPRRRMNTNKQASSPARSATGSLKNDRLDFSVPVTYRALAAQGHQSRKERELADDSASDTWLTWKEADASFCDSDDTMCIETAQNTTGPLRVHFVKFYSGSEEFVTSAEHCFTEGQRVQQNKMMNGYGNIAGSGDELECTADEVVSNETLIASVRSNQN